MPAGCQRQFFVPIRQDVCSVAFRSPLSKWPVNLLLPCVSLDGHLFVEHPVVSAILGASQDSTGSFAVYKGLPPQQLSYWPDRV